jgi:GAF domain-containing protein
MTRQTEDSARLQDILGAFHAGATTRAETHATVIDLILERVPCARVSMWKFDGDEGDPSLLCFASKSAGGALDNSDRRLQPSEYGAFFKTLIESGTYPSRDAMADPQLAPLRASYLAPNRVASLLCVAFLLNDRAYGMVCCEETERRDWPASEVFALRGICNKIALLMWAAPGSVLRTTPSLAARTAPAAPPTLPTAAPSRRR